MESDNFLSSILLYSPPGVGKTTILRELICKLSEREPPLRVSVIDSREEIISGIDENVCADFFLSYPKESAITFATRAMTPQIIICDEISSFDEASSVLNSASCGVTFVATTHASDIEELKSKEILSPLFKKGIFDYALEVSRRQGSKKYEFTLYSLKECTV
jgi:stage III sporulation protein AA